MTTVCETVKVQMLNLAAKLAAVEENEDSWFLVHLFKHSHPKEFLRICHFVLAQFLELDYEYFSKGWPLITQLDGASLHTPTSETSNFASVSTASTTSFRKLKRFRSRSPPSRSKPNQENHPTRQDGRSPALNQTTKSASSSKLGWMKMKNLLPSKVPVTATPPNIERSASAVLVNLPHSPSTSVISNSQNPNDGSRCAQRPQNFENADYALCRYIIDFMVQSPGMLSVEGLFRRPGSQSRMKLLYNQLKEVLVGSYSGLGTASSRPLLTILPSAPLMPKSIAGSQSRQSDRRAAIYGLLESSLAYDVASVLLRCLSCTRISVETADTGLIPHKAADLFVKTTRLQHRLKNEVEFYIPNRKEDWTHILCHGRQLLAYRVIIQFLLPLPERYLLLKLLSLLHKIASNTAETRMSSEALARCLAVAVFGMPEDSDLMGCYIDTLINLIELYEELESMPRSVFLQVRKYLKSKMGTSPLKNLQRIDVDQIPIGSQMVNRSVLKRSWATCQVSLDASYSCLPSTPSGKENRNFSLSNLCVGFKSSSTTDMRNSCTPSTLLRQSSASFDAKATSNTPLKEPQSQRSRPRSPFRSWKKQRSAIFLKKSKSVCPSTQTSVTMREKKNVGCGTSPLR